jgi:hypothetical protein
MEFTRRAAILLLLSTPALSLSGEDNERVVNLDGFSLIINFGTDQMKIGALEIWNALHPVPRSNLVLL